MNKLLLLVTFIIRVGSGIVMLMQGYEKLTGGFTLKGLVPESSLTILIHQSGISGFSQI